GNVRITALVLPETSPLADFVDCHGSLRSAERQFGVPIFPVALVAYRPQLTALPILPSPRPGNEILTSRFSPQSGNADGVRVRYSSGRTGAERIAHRSDDQGDVDHGVRRDTVRTGGRIGAGESNVHQREELVD